MVPRREGPGGQDQVFRKMKIVISPRGRRDLANQLGYLVDQGAAAAATRLERRLTRYIEDTIANFPRTGDYIPERQLWEMWVPRTKMVIWYRFTADELQIVQVWHTSQNRQGS